MTWLYEQAEIPKFMREERYERRESYKSDKDAKAMRGRKSERWKGDFANMS